MAVLLSRARDEHCRWPVCEAVEPARGEQPDIFRGRLVCGAPVSWPTSYCAEHRLRVYERAPAATPGRDASVRAAFAAPDLQPELTEIFG